jgi:DNA-binding beta-propeller fold protein YncE
MTTLLVSFHGGDSKGSINNIVAFPQDGGKPYDLLSPPTLSAGANSLKELRKFLFDPTGSCLYVANGSKERNQVLRFLPPLGSGKQWRYGGIFISAELDHPFDVIFGFGGDLFVTSQDKNWVSRYAASGAGKGVFAEGFEGVRGLAFDGSRLYVADPVAGRVCQFDEEGNETGAFTVNEPIHLLYDPARKWLLIGSEADNSVLAWTPTKPSAPPVTVIAGGGAKIDRTAGLALPASSGTTADLLVVSRVKRQVLAFPLDFSSGKPVWNPIKRKVVLDEKQMPDEPEFVGIQGQLYG